MPERIENPMIVDSLWGSCREGPGKGMEEKLNGPGYANMAADIFVPEEGAYQYALERVSLDKDLNQEFKEMVVEWFFSGEWIKEE